MSQADLDLTLHRREIGAYTIDLRYVDSTSEAVNQVSGLAPVCFDDAALRERSLDPAATGVYLAQQLLAGEDVRGFFREALATAEARDLPLSLRLTAGPNAPELHSLRWETLRLPGEDAPLLTGENLRFSRFLSPQDWRPVRPQPQAEMRALVAIASPGNTAKWQVAEVKTEDELSAARAGLGDIPTVELATRGQVTLEAITARLRDGCDILYLVAHGMLVGGEPQILLEQADGTGVWTAGRELVTRIDELQERPRLVVLVSCQSAGKGTDPTTQDDGALSGLGPRLAEAGVPAVIAMQGNLSMATAAVLIPKFFAELRRDGQVDRAMAVARGTVRARPDWWMPVLFMSLKSGLLWAPSSADAKAEIPRKAFEPETIYIPAGPFLMGATPVEGLVIPSYETPAHEVSLPAFRIGKYPVTNRQYAAFVKDKKDQPAPQGWFNREPPPVILDHPVTSVSWYDALAYCAWLSGETKRIYTLPSEAEWEKACSNDFSRSAPRRTAEVVTTNRYPWGDNWVDGRCNAVGSGTTAVTAHPAGASAYGVEDLLGNVQEWTRSLWGAQPAQPEFGYPYDPADGREVLTPDDLPAQARLVHRGGSFKSAPAELRCSARGNSLPESKIAWRGFRVAMEV